MRKLSFAVCVALLFLGATPFKLRNALDRAVTNEREAVIRYEAYAQKAMEEGYPGAAALFHAAARAESVHATRFAQAMTERGLPVPEPPSIAPLVGSTADNLRAAAAAEVTERDRTYREAIDAASEASDAALVKIFDQTRDTEVEHANLLQAASRNLEKMKETKTFFVCDECGYTTDIELPMCVLCRLNKHPHEVH